MRPKIYLFANHFARTVDVVLRGYSGYNTRWALKVLDRVFPEKPDDDDSESEPIAVTVFFGARLTFTLLSPSR
ncbi:hypothetical protein K1719_026001 [Acacia pycnantha]|nr:hypothetical protein K1719_026001 [Acacia pycnantha]